MSKLKKVLLMCTAYVLVAALAIGGTIAYLTSEDSDVNVMTLGNVSIEQHEYERVVDANGNYKTDTIDDQTSYVLKDFTQAKPLLPATDPSNHGAGTWDSTTVRMSQVDSYGGMQVFVNSNAQDKFVTVENTGKTDAYVRTLVAVECGSTDGSLVGTSYHSTWTKNEIGVITVDGNDYYLIEYVYAGGKLSDGSWRHENGILPAGDTSYPNLSQVYIKSTATNEDMIALDGNGNGTLDILVFSQAVQAAGFADAETALNAGFGDITTTNHPWAGEGNAPVIPVVVENDADLAAAIADGAMIYLKDGNYNLPAGTAIPAGTSLIATGDNANIAIPAPTAKNTSAVTLGDNVTLKGFKITDNGQSIGNGEAGLVLANGKNVVVEDCEFDISGTNAIALAVGGNANGLTVKNCDFVGGYKHIGPAPGNPKGVVIDGCTFTGANSTYAIHLNATSHDTVIKNSKIALFNTFFGFGGDAGKLVFDNCEFVVVSGKTNVVKLYRDADFINCDFEEGFLFSDANKDIKVTFEGGSWGSGTIKEHFLADSFTYNMDATFDGDAWYWNTTTDTWVDK